MFVALLEPELAVGVGAEGGVSHREVFVKPLLRCVSRGGSITLVKPMKRRDLVRAMERAGFAVLRDQGDHTVYQCPCGKHRAPVPRHREITARVVDSVSKTPCMEKGWL